MAPAPRKRFILELEPDSEPIVGCLRDPEDGGSFEFTGWLGFSSALGRVLTAATEAPAASDGGLPGARGR